MTLKPNRISGRNSDKGYYVTLTIGGTRYYDDALLLVILEYIPGGADALEKIERDEPFDLYF